MSDRTVIYAWWNTLNTSRFFVLPAGTSQRYDQSDGHYEAKEYISARNLAPDTAFAFWHRQSIDRAFTSGELQHPLFIYWGGDYETVKAGLGEGPPGYSITANGPGSAFELDRQVALDADGLPDPADQPGVRQLLERLQGFSQPVELSAPEQQWLHAYVTDFADDPPPLLHEVATELTRRRLLPAQQVQTLWESWARYEKPKRATSRYRIADPYLADRLRFDLPGVWESIAEDGPAVAGTIAAVPSERVLGTLREWGLADDGESATQTAIRYWLVVHRELSGADWQASLSAVASVMAERGVGSGTWLQLWTEFTELGWSEIPLEPDGTRVPPYLNDFADGVRVVLDPATPAGLVQVIRRWMNEYRQRWDSLKSVAPEQVISYPDYRYSDLILDLQRVDALEPEESGPALAIGVTEYPSRLRDSWPEFETLTEGQTRWLRSQLAKDRANIQAIGFCLELLVGHGVGTAEDVEVLTKRWRSVLAKKYSTSYAEWRHPMVTLTILAADTNSPLFDTLEKWWQRPAPAWKNNLYPLTMVGGPTPERLAILTEAIRRGDDSRSMLMRSWTLAHAKLYGGTPLESFAQLISSETLYEHPALGVPAAVHRADHPLWYFTFDVFSLHWWDRGVAVIDDPNVPESVKAIAWKALAQHRVVNYPGDFRLLPPARIAAAQEWFDAASQYWSPRVDLKSRKWL